jgi:hypothetical protein
MEKKVLVVLLGAWIAFQSGVSAQPHITRQPESRAVVLGGSVTLSVDAAGVPPLRYQWLFNGEEIPNARGRAFRFTAAPSRAGNYAVRIFDAAGQATTSSSAKVDVVKRPTFLVQPKNAIVGEHTVAEFRTVLNESGPYRRMIWHNNNPIEGPHEIPPSTGYITDQPVLTMKDPLNDPTWNSVYWLAVTNPAVGVTSRKARLTVVGPPVLRVQPRDYTVRPGVTVTFRVQAVATAGPPKTYQWYKDGRILPGATRPTFVVSRVKPEDQGNYYCIVTSIGGETESWGGFLNVITPPN